MSMQARESRRLRAVGEPCGAPFVDQVIRRQEYEKAHPDVKIEFCPPAWQALLPPAWQAVIPEGDGSTIIVRYELRSLLDKLESLDERR